MEALLGCPSFPQFGLHFTRGLTIAAQRAQGWAACCPHRGHESAGPALLSDCLAPWCLVHSAGDLAAAMFPGPADASCRSFHKNRRRSCANMSVAGVHLPTLAAGSLAVQHLLHFFVGGCSLQWVGDLDLWIAQVRRQTLFFCCVCCDHELQHRLHSCQWLVGCLAFC